MTRPSTEACWSCRESRPGDRARGSRTRAPLTSSPCRRCCGGTWSTTASRRRPLSSSPSHEHRPPWPQTRRPWGRRSQSCAPPRPPSSRCPYRRRTLRARCRRRWRGRELLLQLVHVHDHLLHLGVRELRDVAPSHDDHPLTQRALHEQAQDVPADVASGAQQHRLVLDLGHHHRSRVASGTSGGVFGRLSWTRVVNRLEVHGGKLARRRDTDSKELSANGCSPHRSHFIGSLGSARSHGLPRLVLSRRGSRA